MDILKRITELMNERDWTYYRLEKEANLSHSSVVNMFKRNNLPTIPTLEAICKAFGISEAQFFSENKKAVVLTEEQEALLSVWASLNDEQKRLLFELMKKI